MRGATRDGGRLRSLHDELIDKQKRHPGFQIVQQLLQVRLLHLATDDQGDEAILGLRPLQVHLRRLHAAAELRDGAGDPLQQRRAGDRYRLAAEERRAGRNRAGRIVRGVRTLLARFEPIENIERVRKHGALFENVRERQPDRGEQRDDEHDIGRNRHVRIAREIAIQCNIGGHDGGENTGLIRASM